MSAGWKLIRTQGRTVYHSRRITDRWRLAVIAPTPIDPDVPWKWCVYDMAQGSNTGGLLWESGYVGSWQEGRQAATAAALRLEAKS